MLNSKYFVKDPSSREQEPKSFTFLYNYHENLEKYIHKTYNKTTGFGHYMITNLSNQIDKEGLILADTLCYVVSFLNNTNRFDRWYPNTYLYGKINSSSFFEKISSKKHFEKIKTIFEVDNEDDLKTKLANNKENSKDRIRYGRGGFEDVPFVYELINPEKISIYR